MMDFADRAQEQGEQSLRQSLRERVVYRGESEIHCRDCGEEIPERRRRAVPGCTRCVDCQEDADGS